MTIARKVALLLALPVVALAWSATRDAAPAGASSHREAPLLTEDPAVDCTDLYAFVSPDRPDTVTIVANWIPFEEPSGGPNYYKFADFETARYEIHVDQDGDAKEDLTFLVQFKTRVKNDKTFLYNTGPITYDDKARTYTNLNVEQFYRVFLVRGPRRGAESRLLGEFLLVAPNHVGPKSVPSYDALVRPAIHDIADGVRVFCGPRDDPFFINLGRAFDLLNVDPVLPGGLDEQAGLAPDHLRGFNCHTIALQVPIALLTGAGEAPWGPDDPRAIVGIWTTASRRSVTLKPRGDREPFGDWVQVSRLGMPLVNELVIPRGQKDAFNASEPKDDGQFLGFVQNPEIAGILNALFKLKVPPAPRNDLVTVFLKGVPGLNEKGAPCEYLRLNTAIPPSPEPHRLGVLAGQKDGFPNGRRLGDDVVDIALRVAAGVLAGPEYDAAPANALGDTVVGNDRPFLKAFPYVAPPHDGVNREH